MIVDTGAQEGIFNVGGRGGGILNVIFQKCSYFTDLFPNT